MDELINLIISYQKDREDECFEQIILKLENVINKGLANVSQNDFEDLRQNILMKVHKVILNFNILINDESDVSKICAQFLKYISMAIQSVRNKFYNNTYNFNNELVKLNKINPEGEELNELISDKSYEDECNYFLPKLSDEENNFLNLFIQGNVVLTEKEVANKLGLTQQAVHKRKKKIIEKINKLKSI